MTVRVTAQLVEREGLVASGRLDRLERADEWPAALDVVDHRNRHHTVGSTPAATSSVPSSRKGSRSVNVEPDPGRLSTEMSPPSARASRREIVNPSPVPPYWRELA